METKIPSHALMEIEFEVLTNKKPVRRVRLILEKIANEGAPDVEPSILHSQSTLTDNERIESRVWSVNDARLVQDHLLQQLQLIVDEVDYERSEIIVTKDSHNLFFLKNCYCQHCGRLFLQHYGTIAGVMKKCSGCHKLTRCSHEKVERK